MGAGWHEREHAAFGFPFRRSASASRGWRSRSRSCAPSSTTARSTTTAPTTRARPLRAAPAPAAGPRADHPGRRREAARRAPGGGVRGRVQRRLRDPGRTRAAQQRLDAACEAIGRDPATLTRSLMTRCVVGATPVELDRRLRRVAERAARTRPTIASSLDRDAWIVGTPDEVLERIAAYREAGGRALHAAAPRPRRSRHAGRARDLRPAAGVLRAFSGPLGYGADGSRGHSSAGRASGWQPEGQGFDPPWLHSTKCLHNRSCSTPCALPARSVTFGSWRRRRGRTRLDHPLRRIVGAGFSPNPERATAAASRPRAYRSRLGRRWRRRRSCQVDSFG